MMDDIQIFVGQQALSRPQSYFGGNKGRWSAFAGLDSCPSQSMLGLHWTRSRFGYRYTTVAWGSR